MSMLVVQQAAKRFGGIAALDGCDLEVREGEIAGLIGPNGSGKTTLFNMMTGYGRLDSGTVTFRDSAISRSSPRKVFGLGIGRTFQLTRIFPRLTVLENVHIGARRRGLIASVRHWKAGREHQRALESLDFVGLTRLRDARAGSLSYGQRKLLEFASVLAAQPSLILLDEPAGGVNPTMIELMAAKIRQLNQNGTTFLVVEHNMSFVMDLCHRVTVLHRGKTISHGEPTFVRRDPAVLEAYLGD